MTTSLIIQHTLFSAGGAGLGWFPMRWWKQRRTRTRATSHRKRGRITRQGLLVALLVLASVVSAALYVVQTRQQTATARQLTRYVECQTSVNQKFLETLQSRSAVQGKQLEEQVATYDSEIQLLRVTRQRNEAESDMAITQHINKLELLKSAVIEVIDKRNEEPLPSLDCEVVAQ